MESAIGEDIVKALRKPRMKRNGSDSPGDFNLTVRFRGIDFSPVGNGITIEDKRHESMQYGVI